MRAHRDRQCSEVQGSRVVDIPVVLNYSDDLGTIVFAQELSGVVSDIAETLDNQLHSRQVVLSINAIGTDVVQISANGVFYASSRRLGSSRNPALGKRLPCDACAGIDCINLPVRLNLSAIQAISRSPVPTSGAGTFNVGEIRRRFDNSWVKRRVFRFSS